MGWQSVFQNIEQPKTGQFIEELVRMDVVRKPFKLAFDLQGMWLQRARCTK